MSREQEAMRGRNPLDHSYKQCARCGTEFEKRRSTYIERGRYTPVWTRRKLCDNCLPQFVYHKVDREQVINLLKTGMKQAEVARTFGLSRQRVHQIKQTYEAHRIL